MPEITRHIEMSAPADGECQGCGAAKAIRIRLGQQQGWVVNLCLGCIRWMAGLRFALDDSRCAYCHQPESLSVHHAESGHPNPHAFASSSNNGVDPVSGLKFCMGPEDVPFIVEPPHEAGRVLYAIEHLEGVGLGNCAAAIRGLRERNEMLKANWVHCDCGARKPSEGSCPICDGRPVPLGVCICREYLPGRRPHA